MKLAKVLLIAIGAFTSIGCVFALQASRTTKSLFVTNGIPGLCTVKVRGISLMANENAPVLRYVSEVSGTCTLHWIYPTD